MKARPPISKDGNALIQRLFLFAVIVLACAVLAGLAFLGNRGPGRQSGSRSVLLALGGHPFQRRPGVRVS